MPRYIDAEGLNLYDDLFMKGKNDSGVWVRYRDVEKLIRSAPTADVEEVRHGEWEMIPPPKVYQDGAYVRFRCSECGTEYESSGRYCPNCGARMDGKEQTDG